MNEQKSSSKNVIQEGSVRKGGLNTDKPTIPRPIPPKAQAPPKATALDRLEDLFNAFKSDYEWYKRLEGENKRLEKENDKLREDLMTKEE